MNYAEKFGFTPAQVAAVKEKEIRDGYYDGRFEMDYIEEKPCKPETDDLPAEPEPEKQSRQKRPHKGGK